MGTQQFLPVDAVCTASLLVLKHPQYISCTHTVQHTNTVCGSSMRGHLEHQCAQFLCKSTVGVHNAHAASLITVPHLQHRFEPVEKTGVPLEYQYVHVYPWTINESFFYLRLVLLGKLDKQRAFTSRTSYKFLESVPLL